jgi:hypothetical protein
MIDVRDDGDIAQQRIRDALNRLALQQHLISISDRDGVDRGGDVDPPATDHSGGSAIIRRRAAGVRVTLAQLNFTIGAFNANLERMQRAVARADADGASLVVFSELATTGYPPRDLLAHARFVDRNLDLLERLATSRCCRPTTSSTRTDTSSRHGRWPRSRSAARDWA